MMRVCLWAVVSATLTACAVAVPARPGAVALTIQNDDDAPAHVEIWSVGEEQAGGPFVVSSGEVEPGQATTVGIDALHAASRGLRVVVNSFDALRGPFDGCDDPEEPEIRVQPNGRPKLCLSVGAE